MLGTPKLEFDHLLSQMERSGLKIQINSRKDNVVIKKPHLSTQYMLSIFSPNGRRGHNTLASHLPNFTLVEFFTV